MQERDIQALIFGDHYYSTDDLRYNQKVGVMYSKNELTEFFKEKERIVEGGDERVERLPLKTFNSKHCFYIKGGYLQSLYAQYLSTLAEDYEANQKTLFDRNADDIIMARAFSEVEGTLHVENVPTTHKKIREIYNGRVLTDKNDIIVRNMLDAMKFIVKERPSFNKENLLRIYKTLSRDCLDEEDVLKEGACYRDDGVSVGGYEGAPTEEIEECMNTLFAFANDEENIRRYGVLLPHICHYYILYVHPYFDYNGRTARTVAFWLNYVYDISSAPLFMSEAINEKKREYYVAISNTRNAGNDLTFFLGYILEIAIQYSLVYKNLECAKKLLEQTGDTLSTTEWGYMKKIITHNATGYFTYKLFLEYINGAMSKQGALKILNTFADYGLLTRGTNRKQESVYKVNSEILPYRFH